LAKLGYRLKRKPRAGSNGVLKPTVRRTVGTQSTVLIRRTLISSSGGADDVLPRSHRFSSARGPGRVGATSFFSAPITIVSGDDNAQTVKFI